MYIEYARMTISCQQKLVHGTQFCVSNCPANAPNSVFQYLRIEKPEDLPPENVRIIDVAVLDMNHRWPNLGHDSLVHLVQDCACDVMESLHEAGLTLRVLSFEVRNRGMIPELPGGRFNIYLGTGGPGHINPHHNDGNSEGAQGIQENPEWERPLFRLFDEIYEDKSSVLLSVCHTFGVMCRWSGIAAPVLRGPEKGGKSSGIMENILTSEAVQHPWFSRFADRLPDGRRLRVVDNRLYDLIPVNPMPSGVQIIGKETLTPGGPQGDALTMVEWDHDRDSVMPRFFGVNHHPEIVDLNRQMLILQSKFKREEVSSTWYNERMEILTRQYQDNEVQQQLTITSDYTIIAPLRYFLLRQIRLRAANLGFNLPLHEEQIFESYA
jgi:hypothetical protein